MKTATVLQFTDLENLCKFIKFVHATSYRINTTKMTVKLQLTSFETAIAVKEFHAVVVEQLEKV